VTISPDGKIKPLEVESARSGLFIKGFGLQGTTKAEITQEIINKNGSKTVEVSIFGINGEAGLPFAPKGTIKGEFSFTISQGGSVTLNTDGRSAATAFPSWGVYSYEPGRAQPKVLLEASETNPQALQRRPVEIRPKVK
jgi:hypothetical protein